MTLPTARTVIEVLETVVADDEAVQGCHALVAQGFALALDDFVWREGAERLLDLASIVKIDFQANTRAEVAVLAGRCRDYDVKLLAEKVGTEDDVEWARAQGFDLFQGYAIERPHIVEGRTVRVKIGMLGGEVVNVAPEHDDCAAVAAATGRPVKQIWAEALAAAVARGAAEEQDALPR